MSLRLTEAQSADAPSKRFGRFENGLHMSRHLHPTPYLADNPFAIHKKCGPFHSHVLPPVQRFLAPDPIGMVGRGLRVRGKNMLELVLGVGLVVQLRTV